jgi:hypothetical protein
MIAAVSQTDVRVGSGGAGGAGVGRAGSVGRGPIWPRATRWTGTGIVCAWAAFWSWFAASVTLSEGGEALVYGAGALVIALGLAGAVLKWPRAGGMVAISAGALSMVVFAYPNLWMMMGLPLVVGGALAAVGGRVQRDHG